MQRRHFMLGAASLGAITASGLPLVACAQAAPVPPERGALLIRGGYVMTMDAELGDIDVGDVQILNGEITAVGKDLDAGDAEVIEADGTIVLPGFVETHWHMWNALLRSMSGDTKEFGYFPTRIGLGKNYQPRDMYLGTRLGVAEALFSGITTVHDWCHNVRGPAFALEDLRALQESGIRARFSYGINAAENGRLDLESLQRLHGDWRSHSAEGLIALGLAWAGLGATPQAAALGKADIEAARALGIPISVHASSTKEQIGQIKAIADAGLLGPDLQVIHATQATGEEIKLLKEADTAVSLSPFSELRIGYGLTPTMKFVDAGVRTGLSVDTTALSGNADMFGIMKVVQNLGNAMAEDEFKLPARRVLELATIGGAQSLGMDATVGSLRPGKRADVIVISLDAPNLGLFTDPSHLLVEAAQPLNVTTVIVDGRLLKRDGELTGLDTEIVNDEAAAALADLRTRASWR
jgi:cytosine/adenosine deaminase-related metal-dependent hydrolase